MSPEAVWPPELPEVVLDWPVPRGVKVRPVRWVGGGRGELPGTFSGGGGCGDGVGGDLQ